MGDVVALSLFESLRKQKDADTAYQVDGSVIMFTGVRYERMNPEDRCGSLLPKAVGQAHQTKK